MYDKINTIVEFINQKTNHFHPEIGIVLGSGLDGLASAIKIEHVIYYSDMPHFPVSTVKGHSGQLLFGTIAGRRVIAMRGRFHYYEGYPMTEVV